MYTQDDDLPRHDPAQCNALLDRLLPPAGELLAELAPEGWARSPLRYVFHPSLEQLLEEEADERRVMEELLGRYSDVRIRLDREAIVKAVAEDRTPVEPEREVVQLVGRVLWDIFSDHNVVFDSAGVAYDLGTFLESSRRIAAKLTERYAELDHTFDDMDVCMGTGLCHARSDISPVFRWVFARLRAAGCGWRYALPLWRPSPFADDEEWTCELDAAMDAEREDLERDELELDDGEDEIDDVLDTLDVLYDAHTKDASDEPPQIVTAYRDVFGSLPYGWPADPIDEWRR